MKTTNCFVGVGQALACVKYVSTFFDTLVLNEGRCGSWSASGGSRCRLFGAGSNRKVQLAAEERVVAKALTEHRRAVVEVGHQ